MRDYCGWKSSQTINEINMFSDFYIGQEATISKTFVFDEVVAFSELSLDRNPIHLDKEYAKKGIFSDLIVHGLLTSSINKCCNCK